MITQHVFCIVRPRPVRWCMLLPPLQILLHNDSAKKQEKSNKSDPTGEFWWVIPVVVIALCLSGCSSENTVGAAPDYVKIGPSDGNRDKNPNCYSYVLGDYTMSHDPGDFSMSFTDYSVSSVADAVERDMKALNRGCRRIESYDSPIRSNEYRIALRVSQLEQINTPYGPIPDFLGWDYHFMVQTSSGLWAEKRGPAGESILHSSGNPSTLSWDNANTTGFYTSEIIYFAITR